MSISPSVEKKIEALKKRYVKESENKKELLQILNEVEVPEHVYNSNAIENSTLTLEETDRILREIDLDRYINQRELFEAKNLARVVEYINSNAVKKNLSFDIILFLHKVLLSNISDEFAGRWRKEKEWVKVGDHIAPDPVHIQMLLENMILEYKLSYSENVISRIAKLHLTFEHIHPFCDGNGRIGRVIINYLLIQEGYPPVNIKFSNKVEYYKAFKEFDEKNKTGIMESLLKESLVESFYKRLAYLEGKQIVSLSEYSKTSPQSHSNLLNKAKRQTIEAFREKERWKIGVETLSFNHF